MIAFTDGAGFYQCDLAQGQPFPSWAHGMTQLTEEQRLQWLSTSNVGSVIPKAVTMRQARIALRKAGLLGQVTAAINSMQGEAGDDAKIEWEFSSEVHRDRPLVQALAPILGMTNQQLDQLFIDASKL